MKFNINNIVGWIIFSLMLASFTSCKIEAVEYKRFEKLNLTGLNSMPTINLDLVYYNPNAVGCRVKNAVCFIINGSDTFATAFLANEIRLSPNSEFSIPVSSYIAPQSLIGITTRSLFNNSDLTIDFAGSVTIQKFIFKKKFVFRATEKFNRNQLFK